MAECDDCGEDHGTIEENIVRTYRKYKFLMVGFFGSILTLAFSAYMIFGYFGALAVVAAFGIYYFYVQMSVTLRWGDRLEAIRGSESSQALPHGGVPKNYDGGQYV